MSARVVIVGGGIAGLSAAYRLTIEKKKRADAFEIVLVEASDHLGGVIKSQSQDGYVIEHGPDSFVLDKPWAHDLCQDLGLGHELIPLNEGDRRAYVAINNKIHPLPDGFFMIAPTQLLPFVTSPIFSLAGKLRAGLDLVLPKGEGLGDESVAQFIRRRLGNELFERAGQPLVGGIYMGDAERLSATCAIPRFVQLEQRHGSIIRGLLREKKSQAHLASGARYSLFASLKGGIGSLVERLVQALAEERVLLNAPVQEVLRSPEHGFRLKMANQETLLADGLILALPAPQAAKIVGSLSAKLADALASIECVSSLVVNLLFSEQQVDCPEDLVGLVVPAQEGAQMLAASFISKKFSNRAAGRMIMVRVFMGGALRPELMNKPDHQIATLAVKELQTYLGFKGQPINTYISRWPQSMPQYQAGHTKLVAQIGHWVREFSGLALAGNCYQGVGIPDCILSGQTAAEEVLESMHKRNSLAVG
jgi:oxygen-dependent protoporphyrinogen oxidase